MNFFPCWIAIVFTAKNPLGKRRMIKIEQKIDRFTAFSELIFGKKKKKLALQSGHLILPLLESLFFHHKL